MNRFWFLMRLALPSVLVLAACDDDSTKPANESPPQSSRFAHSIGSSSGDDVAWGVAGLSNGTRLVAGHFFDSATFNAPAQSDSLVSAGGADLFFVGYDAHGARQFGRSFGGSGNDLTTSVEAAPDGGFLATGIFSGTAYFAGASITSAGQDDIYVARFDATANPVWVLSAGGSAEDAGWDVALDRDGDVMVTGSFQGTAAFGATNLTSNGMTDAFLAEFSSGGAPMSARSFGGIGDDEPSGVCVDASNNAFVCGRFADTVDFGAGDVTAAGSSDVFIIKYAPNGDFAWVRTGGGPASDGSGGVASDGTGNVVDAYAFADVATFADSTLVSSGSGDIALACYGPGGELRWARRYGGAGEDFPQDITIVGNRIYVTGGFSGTIAFGSTTLVSAGDEDVFLAEFNSDGHAVWAERAGGSGFEYGRGIDHAGDRTLVCGAFVLTATFGHDDLHLTAQGQGDAFIYQR